MSFEPLKPVTMFKHYFRDTVNANVMNAFPVMCINEAVRLIND